MNKVYLAFALLAVIFYPIAAVSSGLEEIAPALTAFNSVLVAGEKADAMDWVGAAKIALTLSQSEQTVKEATASAISQDSYLLNVHHTEPISSGTAMGAGYLNILADNEFQGRNTVKTKQYLALSDVADVQFTTSSKNSDKAEDYLVFDSDAAAYTYRMDFTPRADSERSGNDAVDFEGRTLHMLGREYRVTNADISGNGFRLSLLSGDIKDTLEEGQSRAYTLGGVTLAVSVDLIPTEQDRVKMTINGNDMGTMKESYNYAIPGTDFHIGIGEVLENEASESAGGRDSVEFYLGANIIDLEDDDITDSIFYSDGLTYNSKRAEDVYVKIIGEISTGDVYLSLLSVEWRPNSEIKIPMGKGLASFASESQIFGSTNTHKSFDVVLDSEAGNSKETIELSPENDKYKLSFETTQGSYSIDAYEMSGSALVTKVKCAEGGTATQEDMIVFSRNKNSIVARVSDITADAAGSGTIKLNDLGGESNTYNLINHVAVVTWHGNTYILTEQNLGAQVALTDLNGDGANTGEVVGIWTKYGGEIRIGYDRSWAAISGVEFMEHPDGKETSGHQGSIKILITSPSNTPHASAPAFTDSSTISFNSYKDKRYARTLWGTYVVDDLGIRKKITITYPENELNFNVKLVGGESKEASSSALSSKAEWTILTDEIRENKNLIVIGGPCANEVAASLLESGERCNAGFTPGEAMIKLIDLKTGYYAVVIAGWEKEDTADAVYVFNNYKNYPSFKGTEVKLRGKTIISQNA